ncbi:TPA: hypothetical protein ACX4EX_000848 [Yersinia enterocolitica]|uniref:hypothetical protein n=1 Tax=Yersinia enterocolitica TaxID=630 RepID=UPI0005FCE308|nr:hypothetical protein [Yersinia enterocolitica]EKN5931003.1 hypothetical protein [Yersinia enterocolitica]ELX2275949.1 hypothetical protein [Yersinia enterocolitica]ELY5261205.1 hypothetical protein [Yersinia enterocolitica]CRE41367.1 secretion system effector protein SseF [Yersinia enterocolitica]HDL6628315.1 hypothetical protein [Yersinia enterocolitica]
MAVECVAATSKSSSYGDAFNSIIPTDEPKLGGEKPVIPASYIHKIINDCKAEIISKNDISVKESNNTKKIELDELKNASVKLATKQFFLNAIELVSSLLSFGASVALSVGSCGATTPIAILTGLNLIASLANFVCASYNLYCARNNKEELTMGSEAIQQAVFILANYCQVSPITAKTIARFTSYFIRGGITASLIGVGFFIHPVINSSLCLLLNNYSSALAIIISVAAVGTVGTWKSHDSDAKSAILEKLVKIDKEETKQSGILEGGKDVLNSLEKKINPDKMEALGIVNMI